jgi:WD40 repeat protein
MKRDPLPYENHLEPLPPEVVGVLGDLWGRHWGNVRCAAYGPRESGLAASGGDDKLIRLWDAKTLEPRGVLSGHTSPVVALAFSPDGKKLASCSEGQEDYQIWLWDLAKKTKTPLVGHEDTATQLAFSTDGKWLLSYDKRQNVIQWDSATGGHRDPFRLAGRISCVALSPDGRHVLSGHLDSTLRLWDVEKGGEVRLEGHKDRITSVAFSPSGSRAASACGDGFMRLWDVESGKELKQHPGNSTGLIWLKFTPDGQRIVGCDGISFQTVDAETLNSKGSFASRGTAGLALSPDNQHGLLFGGTNLQLWDLETGVEVQPHRGHAAAVSSVAFTPDGHYLLSGGQDGSVSMWDLEGKHSVGTIKNGGQINSVAISADGRYALIGDTGGKSLSYLEVDPIRLVDSFPPTVAPDGWTRSATFSGNGRLAISGEYNNQYLGKLRLWDMDQRVELQSFGEPNDGYYWCVAFLPDGKQAVSGSANKVIRLWNVATGKEMQSLTGHRGAVTSLACSPDGRHILSGSADATVRLWDLDEVQPKGRLLEGGPKAPITCVTIAPDGKTFAASGKNGQIVVWKTATLERAWHTQLPGEVLGLAYAGDSRHLATANANGTVYILRLPQQ